MNLESKRKLQHKRHSQHCEMLQLILMRDVFPLQTFQSPSSPEMLQAGAFPCCLENTFLLRAWWQPTQCGWPEDLEATLQSVAEFSWSALFFKEGRKSCNLSDKLHKWNRTGIGLNYLGDLPRFVLLRQSSQPQLCHCVLGFICSLY